MCPHVQKDQDIFTLRIERPGSRLQDIMVLCVSAPTITLSFPQFIVCVSCRSGFSSILTFLSVCLDLPSFLFTTEQEMKDPAMLNHSIADMDGFDSDDVETSDEGSDDSNIDHQRMHNNTNLINNDWAHSLSAAPPTPPSPELEYADDVYVCLRHNEIKYRPRLDYMDVVQGDINHTMRGILVDWLVEVAEEYKLTQQTLHLTINYIDRLLSLVPVNRTKLQLVGITAMLVASKYEEIYPPSIDEFVYISDNTYTRDEVLRMESVLLTTLSFCLTCSTPWEFSRRFYMHTKIDKRTKALSDVSW